MKLTYMVEDKKYITVKQVLKEEFLISDRLLLKLKNTQQILLNSQPTFVNALIKENDCIEVILEFPEESQNIVAIPMELSILYEDDCFLIIDKPANIAVHPSILHYSNTLSNGVKAYFDSIGLHKKIRPINRLDKDTSGIIIFAKNEYVQECLIKQMKSGEFSKQYIAIVTGLLKNRNSSITASIARKKDSIIERCVNENGELAITDYYVIRELENMSLLSITLKTGRTHQIRVHMAHIGHPILGDSLYGSTSSIITRQALHSCKVVFTHPITKQRIAIESDIPKDMESILFAKKQTR